MKLWGIEAARGIAALLVVLRHATMILADPHGTSLPFGGLFLFGRAGVEFFFVLSGFILTYVHTQDIGVPAAVPAFWRKRLLRIYPTYWIATAILGAILVLSPTHDLAERQPFHILASLLLLPEIHMPILDVGWSLRHEMLFYLLFSLAIFNRTLGRVAMGLWLLGIAASLAYALATDQPLFPGEAGDLLFRGFNIEFFFGIAAAILVRRRPFHPAPLAIAGTALFLANGLWESFGPPVPFEWPPRVLAYALASALVIYGVAQLDQTRRTGGQTSPASTWRVPRPLTQLGTASYSVYLMHVTILMLVAFVLHRIEGTLPIPAELNFILAVAIAVAGGIAFSALVEQPILRLGRRPRATTPPATPHQAAPLQRGSGAA